MILILDNYDSFTYNLYQLLGKLQPDITVTRNDRMTLEEIRKLQPEKIIISPGPGSPKNRKDFGVCMQVIKELGSKIPILGVCLGHQGIFTAFGGEIKFTEPMHGKQSRIFHGENRIFNGVKNPLSAARYHSLLCDEATTPECIEVTAKTDDNLIMAIEHCDYPIYGLQFHPESVGTEEGLTILKNFLEIDA